MKKNGETVISVRRKLPRMFIIMKTWFVFTICVRCIERIKPLFEAKKMDISMKNASLVDVFRYIPAK